MAVLNDEQTMLRDMARDWARDESPVTAFRKMRDSRPAEGFDPAAWAQVAEMGWAGVIIPESHGGSEFGFLSLGLVIEELGKTLAATPLVANAMAASALILGGDEGQQGEWLPKLADGSCVGTVAVDEGPRHNPTKIEARADKDGDGYKITGTKAFVAEGDSAGLFVVAANSDEGVQLFLVAGDDAGVSRSKRLMADSRSHAEIRFEGAKAMRLGGKLSGEALLEAVLDRGRILLSAEMLGMSIGAFETTLEYMKVRVQFGQTIGSFQALQHRAAELFTQIELARSAVEGALESVDANRVDVDQMASLAKAVASDTVHWMSREMIQLHGGIGMTDEHDAGFYIKRARVLENELGNGAFHRERFARLNGY
ncbi:MULTISPECIES: acyl-CoA dehydrogenase family protein [unclassified Brevundimonas]|uniref:acyl-CoA dehydrogenase family protein n=1 Tax=unclassified Brevundimonas TaxID=2622653 RepID=UPI0025BECD6F|nr:MULTISPECIES: acyl-CoA dehydrogenase family protein [unclassified Brevundimonas]